MNPLLILDRQHRGKTSRPTDAGATFDLDGDRFADPEEAESWHTERILQGAALACALKGGCDFLPVLMGDYAERHKIASAAARPRPRSAYLALHLNAGGGDYAAFFYDQRSANGRTLAEALAGAFREAAFPGIASVKVIPARSGDWTENALSTIKGIWDGPATLSGVCVEAFFMDRPEHRSLFNRDALDGIGAALYRGASRYLTP